MSEFVPVPQSIRDIAAHYQRATQVPCSILSMTRPESDSLPCALCASHAAREGLEINHCLELHMHSALQAERFGGSYIYFCQCSLLFWSSPVIVEGIMTHALIAGPVLVLDAAEIEQEIDSADGSSTVSLQISQIPKIEISRAHSLSELLRMCAGWGSGYREHRMVEAKEELDRQSKLSEYLQDIKTQSEQATTSVSYNYPLDKEHELQEAIRLGDKQTAQELMNELLGIIFFASGNTFDRIRFRVMELVILLSRAAVRGKAPEQEVMAISYRCQRELSQQRSMEGIARWLSGILHEYTDLVFDQKHIKHANVILQAVQYIRHHFREKITLQETASHVGMSPTYFSRIFNEEMECQFSAYINSLRIDHAKMLLLNTRYTLVEISGLVGFEDQGYFSRVFKASTGVTPGVYRSRAGMFPQDNHEIH